METRTKDVQRKPLGMLEGDGKQTIIGPGNGIDDGNKSMKVRTVLLLRSVLLRLVVLQSILQRLMLLRQGIWLDLGGETKREKAKI